MDKRKLARKSVFLQNLVLRKYHMKFDIVPNGGIVTQPMTYDFVSQPLTNEFERYCDYTRYRTFELIADEIRSRFTKEQLVDLCVAEAGVYMGDFAWILNQRFPESKLYLYDTFEGFDKLDMENEVKCSNMGEDVVKLYNSYFNNEGISAEDKIQSVKCKMKYQDQCIFKKGYFPDSAKGDEGNKWVFVSLDMDLYTPILAGIRFFWPNLVEGGYMFIHDYNHRDLTGVKQALNEVESEFGIFKKVPISDWGGTVILCK